MILKHISFWASIRHLQFSSLDFDMYFCISPDIHISIPVTVFFRNRLLNFPWKKRMNIIQDVSMMFCGNILRVHDVFRTSVYLNSMLTIVPTAYLILESRSDISDIFISAKANLEAVLYTVLAIFSIILILSTGENFYS